MATPKVKVLTAVPSLKSTQDEWDEFDKMFWQGVDKGYHPDELSRHGDNVPEEALDSPRDEASGEGDTPVEQDETKLQRLIRERKEKLNE